VVGINEAGTIPAGGGIFGAQARAQYAALARLRWHMFSHGLRSRKGALEVGARAVSFVFYGFGGLAVGAGIGFATFALCAGNQWKFLPILFWAVLFIWQLVPIMLASFQEQFDLGILLRFPVRFGSYYLLYVVFGLLDVSTILGGLCCAGVLVGITLVRPDLFALTLLALIIFAAFNILLVRAIFAWIDRWLAQRKTREILGAVFMVLILSLQLLNPALHRHRNEESSAPLGHGATKEQARQKIQDYQRTKADFQARYGPWLGTANRVQQWLPPGLAAKALQQRVQNQGKPASGSAPKSGSLQSLGMLGLYVLGAGGVLAARLRAEYRGESLGVAPSRKKAAAGRAKSARREGRALLEGSGPVAAVIEKELRTLLRTMPLLYAIGAPLLLVLVFSGAFIRNGPQAHIFPLALPLCIVYAQLGFTRLFYNNLGAEGKGIQLYFLSPTPMRTVLLAKNLFHSVLFGLTILVAGTLAILRLGVPEGVVLAATAAWLLFSLPANLAAGNVFSLTMPYRVNPGRITRQGGSQANALGALLAQLVTMGVGAAVFALCWYLDKMWLAMPIFLALAVVAIVLWMRILRNADAMANKHRDSMIAVLMKE
jgi:ABC-2 type transport system permease protein